MLKSTILIKDAKKILTKDLKANASDNISDISGISELPDSEPNSLSSHVYTKDLELEGNKTDKCTDEFQRRIKDSNSTKSVIQRTQSLHSQPVGAQNTICLPTFSETLRSSKPAPTKSMRDMKLRPNKSYRIIEMPKKDFEEFMAHRMNKNASEIAGKCPNRITFDFINKNELRNQNSILNCSMRNNSKSTGCLKDIEKLENPTEVLKTSRSSENISPESKADLPSNKAQVVVKPTIEKPARSFKSRPLASNSSNQNVNASNVLRDMILKPPDKFSRTLTPSNSFNKDIQIIRQLDNSLNKNPILAKVEPIETESILERNSMNYTAVLKNSMKSTTPKTFVSPLKDDLTSPRLVASKMRILNSNPVPSSSAHQLKKLTATDSKLLAASRTLDDIRKDLDNMRNRPSHRPSNFNKNHAPQIKAEIPKRIEPIKIVKHESRDLNVSLDSNKYLKLIPSPPKNKPSTENDLKSEDTNEDSTATDNESCNEMNESTQSLPTKNKFKSTAFSTIESTRTDQLGSNDFVIGSSTGAFKSLSTLSLERKSNPEDVYLNRSHIKPISRLKSSQSFQHRSVISDDVKRTPAMVKKPTRHSSLNNSFRSLRALMRTKSSSEDKTKSEDATKPTPAPRRLPSFSNFKTRLTDSKIDYQNIPSPIPPNNTRKTDTDDKDPEDDEVSNEIKLLKGPWEKLLKL